MAIVRRSREDIRRNPGSIDWAKVWATTEEDIQRHIKEDGGHEFDFTNARVVVPRAYIQRIRKKFGPTRKKFAKRFGLSERTVEEWGTWARQSPTGPALVLLRVIEREHEAVERALSLGLL